MTSVFEFENFREYLSHLVKASTQRGFQQRLAERAGCEASYLSRTLRGKSNLSGDQAYAIARFLGLASDETDYFMLLVELGKAASKSLREHISSKLTILRERHSRSGKKYGIQAHQTSDDWYYGDWTYSAIHVLCACPELQTSVEIARKLGMPLGVIEEQVKNLCEAGILKATDGKLAQGKSFLHASRDTVNGLRHLTNWRMRGTHECLRSARSEQLNYTNVFTADRAALRMILSDVRQVLQRSNELIQKASDDTAACLNVDLFEI